jgi:hypothetical protein
MAACDASPEQNYSWPAVYTICVKGCLDTDWSDWLGGLALVHTGDGDTLLMGRVIDASALHSLLSRLFDLNLLLLYISRDSAPW